MASSSSGRDTLEFLLRLTEEELKSASIEQVVRWSTCEGTEGLVALRVAAAKAATVGRLDIVAYFIEEKNVAVHTITPEELKECDELDRVVMLSTPLSFAICFKRDEVVNYLLDKVKKEEVETRDCFGRTCLMMAARAGNAQAAHRFLELGADTFASDGGGHQALCLAIEQRHVAVVDLLLQHASIQGGGGLYRALLKQPCECRKMPYDRRHSLA